MRRFKLSAAAFAVVTVVALSISSGASAASLPIHLFDSFNGTSLNPATWNLGTPTPGATVSVHDGSLWLSASSTSPPSFNTAVVLGAGCQVVGDYDAEIEFTLSSWPADSDLTLALSGDGHTFLTSEPEGNFWGLYDLATNALGYNYTQIPAYVHSGALRLTRRNDRITSYFRTDRSATWQRIAQFTGDTAPAWMSMNLWTGVSPFGGQPVSVAIHSFKLEAAGLAVLPQGGFCPPSASSEAAS